MHAKLTEAVENVDFDNELEAAERQQRLDRGLAGGGGGAKAREQARGADGRAALVDGPAADGAARVWRTQGPPEDREAEREEAPPRRAAV